MKAGALVPVLLFAGAAPTFAVSMDVPPTPDNEDATTLPPVVVHPAPNPLDGMEKQLERLRRSLPDLGYKPSDRHSRLAEDINDSNEFQSGFYTQTLTGDPRLEGPPPPYITESDGELAKRSEEEFRAASKPR